MPTPQLGAASLVPTQAATTKVNIQAHLHSNGDIWLVYENGASINYQVWDSASKLWFPVFVDTLAGHSPPAKNLSTLTSAMNDANVLMLFWGTADRMYWQRVDPDGTIHAPAQWPIPGIETERQWVVGRSAGKFTAAYNNPTTTGIKLYDYNPATENWVNERLEVDRSAVGGIANVQNVMISWTEADDTIHITWKETRGGDTYIMYQKEGGAAEEVSGPHASPLIASVPTIAVSRDNSENVWLAFRLQSGTGSKIVAHKRIITGWDAGADMDADGDDGNNPRISVDPENNVHLMYDHDVAATPQLLYRRAQRFGGMGPETQITFTAGQSREAWTPFDFVKRGDPKLYIFWADDTTAAQLRAWWNICLNCILIPPQEFGTCIQVREGAVTPDHYEVVIGKTSVWAGGPMTKAFHPGSQIVQGGAAGDILLDKGYPISADGILDTWYFWRGGASAVVLNIGDLYLLVCREDDTGDIEVIHRVPNSKIVPAGSLLHEFSAGGVDVQRGDFIGIWMAPVSNSIKASNAAEGADTVLLYSNEALPTVGSDLPLVASLQSNTIALVARGPIIEEDQLLLGYVSDNFNEDAEAYLDFVQAQTVVATDAEISGSGSYAITQAVTSLELVWLLVNNGSQRMFYNGSTWSGPFDTQAGGDTPANTNFGSFKAAGHPVEGVLIYWVRASGGDTGYWSRRILRTNSRDTDGAEKHSTLTGIQRDYDVVAKDDDFAGLWANAAGHGSFDHHVSRRVWDAGTETWDGAIDSGDDVLFEVAPGSPGFKEPYLSSGNIHIDSIDAVPTTRAGSPPDFAMMVRGHEEVVAVTVSNRTWFCEEEDEYEEISHLFYDPRNAESPSVPHWGYQKISVDPTDPDHIFITSIGVDYSTGGSGNVIHTIIERTGADTFTRTDHFVLAGDAGIWTAWNAGELGFQHEFDDEGNEHLIYMDFKPGGTVRNDLQVYYQYKPKGGSWGTAIQVSGIDGTSINDVVRGPNIARPVVAANGAFITWDNTTKAAMWWSTATQGAGNAFPDNITDPDNLFDGSEATLASVPAGQTGNVYYHVSELASDSEDDIIPVERAVVGWDIPAGGLIRIYASQAETTNDLTAAAAITDWALLTTIDSTWDNTRSIALHMARRARWIRVEILGGTSVKTDIYNFEIHVMMDRIENGSFPPNPTPGLKQRFWFDRDSHAQAGQITAILEADLPIGSTTIFLSPNTPDDFFDQFTTNDDIVLMKGSRGALDSLAISKVFGHNKAAKSITILFPVDIAFSAGSRLAPPPKWFQIRAKDGSDALIGLSNWIPSIGVAQPDLRSQTYGGDN